MKINFITLRGFSAAYICRDLYSMFRQKKERAAGLFLIIELTLYVAIAVSLALLIIS